MKKSKRRQWVSQVIYAIIASGLLLALFEVYRGQVHAWFFPSNTEYQYVHSTKAFKVGVQYPSIRKRWTYDPTPTRGISVSVPFERAPRGCEFIYGAAVDWARDRKVGPEAPERPRGRYLFKFRYDFRTMRCVSKDLYMNTLELAQRMVVQLVHVRIEKDALIEEPDPLGLEIRKQAEPSEGTALIVAETQVPAENPYMPRREVARNASFSIDLRPGEAELVLSPLHDLKSIIERELKIKIDRCRAEHYCPPILVSVAYLNDKEVQWELHSAEELGIPVEVITNFNGWDLDSFPESWGVPWRFLRGRPERTGVRLPMHTKFIVFDDVVISSSKNFLFWDKDRSSREISVVYRSREVVKLFTELQAMIRTSVFYPLHVDTRKSFTLLMNADRPRGYAASADKPYLPIISEDGVLSSVYGLIYHLFRRSDELVSLIMSPLNNTCADYAGRICLFDILREKLRQNKLSVVLNSWFYLPRDSHDEPQVDPRLWEKGADPTLYLTSHYRSSNQKLMGKGRLPLFFMAQDNRGSHHERFARIGKEALLAGSTNYGEPSTINTVEILKQPFFPEVAALEESTYPEPYFVIRRTAGSPAEQSREGCEFIYEKNIFDLSAPKKKVFALKSLLSVCRAIHPKCGADQVVLPTTDPAEIFRPGSAKIPLAFKTVPVSDSVESYSSYFCLRDSKSGASFVFPAHLIRAWPDVMTRAL